MGSSARGKEKKFFLQMRVHLNCLHTPFPHRSTTLGSSQLCIGLPCPVFCPLWCLICVFVHSKWYCIMYVLYKINQWPCGRGESTTDSEVEPEEGRERRKETVLSSSTAVLAPLEEASYLQDGAGRRESAQSRRCLKGDGHRNNVSLRGGAKQEAF